MARTRVRGSTIFPNLNNGTLIGVFMEIDYLLNVLKGRSLLRRSFANVSFCAEIAERFYSFYWSFVLAGFIIYFFTIIRVYRQAVFIEELT